MRRRRANPLLEFYVGDVRERHGIAASVRDVRFRFHAAALKQLPS
jgi:UDP-glucose 4-epimerase